MNSWVIKNHCQTIPTKYCLPFALFFFFLTKKRSENIELNRVRWWGKRCKVKRSGEAIQSGISECGLFGGKQKLCKDVLTCWYSPLVIGGGLYLWMFIILYGEKHLTSIKLKNIFSLKSRTWSTYVFSQHRIFHSTCWGGFVLFGKLHF